MIVVGAAVALTTREGAEDAAAPTTTKVPLSTPASLGTGLPSASPKATTVTCVYNDASRPADKPVTKPVRTLVPTTGANTLVRMDTSAGPIAMTLANADSPCTVNSFMSLIEQKFFDGTSCHRMTTSEGLRVLQCGDPSGTGMGGPGYEFANEYPTDAYPAGDPKAQIPIAYERGVLAMANAGADTNGSQFFIVYGESQLPPQYTMFGVVDASSMATLDTIAAGGTDDSNGPGDGRPKIPVEIASVRSAN
ncbi:peptidylprolyl isomerase [Nocardia sp. NPDC127579]|uniref:peptidylprolyl isomerase n=1 Tax=Nocardia sp. NPDC127579 TaxID=3345402 RepID=UPI0036329758